MKHRNGIFLNKLILYLVINIFALLPVLSEEQKSTN